MSALGSSFRGLLFIVVALAAAALVALATYAVTRFVLGVEWEFIPTLITALVVGTFFALVFVAPVTKRTTFQVNAVEEREEK